MVFWKEEANSCLRMLNEEKQGAMDNLQGVMCHLANHFTIY